LDNVKPVGTTVVVKILPGGVTDSNPVTPWTLQSAGLTAQTSYNSPAMSGNGQYMYIRSGSTAYRSSGTGTVPHDGHDNVT